MCTVTFARSGNSTIITSNRDEQTGRAPAMPPREYEIDGRKIWFPKDGQSGGTWFALDERGNVTVLLNGAKEPHEFRNDWRKSRGLILLEIFASDPISTWKSIDLDMIEPFTMVLFTSDKLYQLRWDGLRKELVELDPTGNYIWSSSPLYKKEVRNYRKMKFAEFSMTGVDPEKILSFHQIANLKNPDESIIIDRNGFLKTLSITQAVIDESSWQLKYLDLQSGEASSISHNRRLKS